MNKEDKAVWNSVLSRLDEHNAQDQEFQKMMQKSMILLAEGLDKIQISLRGIRTQVSEIP